MLGDINPQTIKIDQQAVVYPGRDHVSTLTIKRFDGRRYAPVDLSLLTRVVLVFPGTDPVIAYDSLLQPTVFTWSGSTLTIDLSDYAMPASILPCHLIAFDAEHPGGQVLVDDNDTTLEFDFRNVSMTGGAAPPVVEFVTEAPIDGETYGRKDGTWVPLSAIVSGVASVNGQTGVVTLDAADVGADPAGEAAAQIVLHEAAVDPHPQYLTQTEGDVRYERGLTAGANITIDRTNPNAPVISATGGGGGGAVDSVNGQTGVVVLDTDDIAEGLTNHYYPQADEDKLAGIEPGAQVNVATNLTSIPDATTVVVASSTGVDATIVGATTTDAGVMTAADKTKLDGVAPGATANSTDAQLRDRSTHTGTQTASTISDFNASTRAQVEAQLIAGANVTLTPGGSGATRTLTIASTGGGGGGGSMIVEDDGVTTVNPATTLNFTGTGVTVTDGGAGEAVINIPGDAVQSVNGQTGVVVLDASDVGADVAGAAAAAVAAHESALDPHPQYLTAAEGNAAYDALGTAAAEAEDARFQSTGLISGGALSINGVDDTKFDVAAGVAIFADYTNPTKSLANIVSFGPFSAVTVPTLATANVTYIGLNSSGAIVQQTTRFTNTQRRSIVSLGAVVHSNRTNLNAVNTIVSVARQLLNQFGDGIRAIGQLNLSGTVYSSVGANLQMQRSAGELFSPGANFHVNPDDPHSATIGAQNPVSFRYRLANGTEYTDRTTIDPGNYDNAGVLTAVPANRYTVQLIAVFQSGVTRLQYGQVLYNQLSDAVAAAQAQSMTVESNIAENGVMRGYVVVKGDATALNDTAQAVFVTLSKFGASAAVSPLAISTTDQLAEGTTNLYHTAARVRNTILTGLSLVTNAAITAADTVLDALGKLQAQITAHFGVGGSTHPAATTSVNGFMSSADKTKLDGVATGATANQTDAFLLARANHTGTQTASTISDFNSATRAQVEAELVAGSNITITPSGSGATRQLTIASTGGSSTIATQSASSSSGVLNLSSTTAPVILVTLTENVTSITLPSGVANQSIERRIVFTQGGAGTYTIPTTTGAWGSIVVDGGAAIPQMGTGVSTVGVYVLANDNNGTWRMYVDQAGLGSAQTNQNLTASRAFATTYTNTTSSPIGVEVVIQSTAAGQIAMTPTIDGSAQGQTTWQVTASGFQYQRYFVVPAGQTYSVSTTGSSATPTLSRWNEMRAP